MEPQICRVNSVCTHQFLHITVLWKQGYSGYRLTGEHALKVLCQRKTGVFNFCSRILAALLWLLHKLLYGGFHRPENQRWA